jgi:methylated-DNA-[protein]-cysteine S-methyltransferase
MKRRPMGSLPARRVHQRAPARSALVMDSTLITGLGRVVIVTSAIGICAVALPDWNDHQLGLDHWRDAAFERKQHPLIDQAIAELTAYMAGTLRSFTVPVDLGPLPAFTRTVLSKLSTTAYGELITYGALAAMAGSPGGARAVGQAVGRNPLPILIACHRVIAGGGKLGGFGLGLEAKRRLLAIEGHHWD